MPLLRPLLLATAFIASTTASLYASDNRYTQLRFVANKEKYGAATTDKKLVNAWGVAIRPAGAGGHFWVTAEDTSFEYVGDVSVSSDPNLRTLHQDGLAEVNLPLGGRGKFATGVVFSDSKDSFIITQQPVTGAEITAPAKFLFSSDGGVISAWTERKKEDGSFERPLAAKKVIDQSGEGAQFFGLAINAAYNRIYAADFGKNPGIKVFDGDFKPASITFDTPFDSNKNGKVDPGEYAPFNIQALTTPRGESHIFVAYAKTQTCPVEEIQKGTCQEGEVFPGEEDISAPEQGRLVEFDEDGKLITKWDDDGKLNAPWGIAYAPSDFGALSDTLLVSNFGDGTIAAYNTQTRQFVDYVRDTGGEVVKIDNIWGILFGNGASLGDTNALYFAAGPNDEKDGVFGVLRPVSK